MKISKEDARDAIGECHEDWELISEDFIGERRWVNTYFSVLKHIPTGTLYGVKWSRGKTESQDEQPFEYEEPNFYEVEAVEVKKIIYKAKKR